MNRSARLTNFAGYVFALLCCIITAYGGCLTYNGSRSTSLATKEEHSDTTISFRSARTDTNGALLAIGKNDTVVVKKTTSAPTMDAASNTARDNQMKRGYDLIFLGIILLLIFYAMPFLSEFSFLQLFTAKFRENLAAQQATANETTNAANQQVRSESGVAGEKPVNESQARQIQSLFQNKEMPIEAFASYQEDPQKGKWGGLAYRNERKITATVTPLPSQPNQLPLFHVQIKVMSTNPLNILYGPVKFHLHPSFAIPNPTIFAMQGVATLELTAWGAFTVGAEADKGGTQLELDLAELPEAPILFRTR